MTDAIATSAPPSATVADAPSPPSTSSTPAHDLAALRRAAAEHTEPAAHAEATGDTLPPGRPETPADYELTFGDDFAPPDGLTIALDESDPRVPMIRQFAHDAGLDQAAFSRLLQIEAQRVIAEHDAIKQAHDAEVAKLGANGPTRIDAARNFLKGILGEQKAGALMDRFVLASDIEAVEDLAKAFTSQGGASVTQTGRVAPERGVSDEAWERMSYAERVAYARQHGQPPRQFSNGRLAAGGR